MTTSNTFAVTIITTYLVPTTHRRYLVYNPILEITIHGTHFTGSERLRYLSKVTKLVSCRVEF